MMAELIEHKTNLKVTRRFDLGTSVVCHQALLRGDIDLYPEYTGSALMLVLKQPEKRHLSSDALFAYMKKTYQQTYAIDWLSPFGFNDNSVTLVSQKLAADYKLKKMSDLTRHAKHLRFGVDSECLNRPDCLPGLRAMYHYRFKTIKEMDLGLIYQALAHGEVDVINGARTDGRVALFNLVPLQDDKHLYPDFKAAPIIRDKTLKQYPELRGVLESLGGTIDDKTMVRLNAEVDAQKKSYQMVAHQFLQEEGLL